MNICSFVSRCIYSRARCLAIGDTLSSICWDTFTSSKGQELQIAILGQGLSCSEILASLKNLSSLFDLLSKFLYCLYITSDSISKHPCSALSLSSWNGAPGALDVLWEYRGVTFFLSVLHNKNKDLMNILGWQEILENLDTSLEWNCVSSEWLCRFVSRFFKKWYSEYIVYLYMYI